MCVLCVCVPVCIIVDSSFITAKHCTAGVYGPEGWLQGNKVTDDDHHHSLRLSSPDKKSNVFPSGVSSRSSPVESCSARSAPELVRPDKHSNKKIKNTNRPARGGGTTLPTIRSPPYTSTLHPPPKKGGGLDHDMSQCPRMRFCSFHTEYAAQPPLIVACTGPPSMFTVTVWPECSQLAMYSSSKTAKLRFCLKISFMD